MNKKVIGQFELLVDMIKNDLNKARKDNNNKDITRNSFRLKYMLNIYNIIKNLDFKLTLSNYMKLKEYNRVGKGSLDRVKEILEKGKLLELKDFKQNKKEKKDLSDLESVVNIGPKLALDLYNMGATNVKKLKKMIKEEKLKVNDKVMLGLKYYKKYKLHIPRKEIDMTYLLFKKIIKKLNKEMKYDDNNMYIFEICGSYRREKPFSNDIDVLITKLGTTEKTKNNDIHLKKIVDIMKEKLSFNDNKPFIRDSMTDNNIVTKFMGFSKFKNNPFRRIDIRFVSYENFYPALLYFTGSMELNQLMRVKAKKLGYKLSEYGLFKNNKKIKIKSEEMFFKKLGLDYIEPRLR
jgi:DNA polymerase/3'-5' exonuclease PolX